MKTKRRSETPEYIAWAGMIQRCTDKKWHRYDRYGGRGITVCERWTSSFEAFLADIGKKPSPQHTLERLNNDGDYNPENVKWATRQEQARNRRSNRVLTFNGETKCIAEWAESTGISATTIEARLRLCRYTVARALTQKVKGRA